MRILVAYASKHGTTREVAESIATRLRQHGLDVELAEATHVRDFAAYQGVVLGGGLYMGKWHSDARRFMKRYRNELAAKPFAVFGMGPDSLEDSKVTESRSQLERSLAATPELKPVAIAIFGGALNPENWRFPFNHLPATDARDWEAIRSWADEVAAALIPVAV